MANVRISELNPAAALGGGEDLPITQDGVTKRATPDQISAPLHLDRANGRVGLGSGAAAPSRLFEIDEPGQVDVTGFYLNVTTTAANGMEAYPLLEGSGGLVQGWRFIPAFSPSAGGFGSCYGLNFRADAKDSAESITQLFGMRAAVRTDASFTGALTNAVGFEIGSPQFLGSAPSAVVVGLDVGAQSGGAANYAIRTSGGDHSFRGDTYPGVDNSYNLGLPSSRWTEVYAATGTINTSDARLKEDVATMEGTAALEFLEGLRPVTYREAQSGKQGEDGEQLPGKRTHMGLLAQEVENHTAALGIDFAGFTKTPLAPDPDGTPPVLPELYGLRYHQFIAPLIAAVKELAVRNSELQARVGALESTA